jgi:hypothetical protein
VPTAAPSDAIEEDAVKVMIGVDPHKGSHTAVAIDDGEDELAKLKVRATRRQLDQLLEWATPFEERTWAIESAGGLGYLLAQQLVAVGEAVLDVPATLAARVRVLGSGWSNKNDPNEALGGGRGAASTATGGGRPRRPRRGAAPAGQAQQRPGAGSEPNRLSAPCPVGRARAGRDLQ